jgi:formylglycine-generating enzyme required for sulfatase activity/serine/threonine protein kinase
MRRKGEEPIPGYRLLNFLGKGGFGEVWKASAPGGTLAALKFVDVSGRHGLKELRAIQRVKQIRHANLITIHAFWLLDVDQNVVSDEQLEVAAIAGKPDAAWAAKRASGDGPPRIAELVVAMNLGDKNLYDRLQECRAEGLPGIPPAELLEHMEDAAKGLDYLNKPCHDLGSGPVAIQHCDVKPQNIMLVGGSAMVCDFGLARVLGDSRATTAAGSPAYMPPECIRGNNPSFSSDQYGLAVTYVELRTGAIPFESEEYADVINAHLNGTLALHRVPPAEREVLKKALALDPSHRFASNLAMVRELRRAYEGGGATPVTPVRQSPYPAPQPDSDILDLTPPDSGNVKGGPVPPTGNEGGGDADRTTPPPPPMRPVMAGPAARGSGVLVGKIGSYAAALLVIVGVAVPLLVFSAPESSSTTVGGGPGGGSEMPTATRRNKVVLNVDPPDAEVTVDGITRMLDSTGNVEVGLSPGVGINVQARRAGYTTFDQYIAYYEIESSVYRIRLIPEGLTGLDSATSDYLVGNYSAAISKLDAYLASFPESAQAWALRADCHLAQESLDLAISDYMEAVSRDATYQSRAGWAYYLRSKKYLESNEQVSALSDLDEAVRLTVSNDEILGMRAKVHLDQGYRYLSEDDARAALRINPSNEMAIEVMNRLGLPVPGPMLENSVGMAFVRIPGGEFVMGSPDLEAGRDVDETQHTVTLSRPFWMGIREVTQADFERVMGTNPSWFSPNGGGASVLPGVDSGRHPVDSVTWQQASEFCVRLSDLPEERALGRVYRLPTEAEWEYACRAGTTTPFSFGESADSTLANFDGNNPYGSGLIGTALNRTTEVGSFAANPYGLYDMHGNVWEWCADWYDKDYAAQGALADPVGPLSGDFRTLRGGSWYSHSNQMRSGFRNSALPSPEKAEPTWGFRVVCETP